MPRDPNKPRGKTSPYSFFVKMCYEEHKKKYPNENVQVTEISKKCAEKWKTMTQNEKQRFCELAQKDAERYHSECLAFGGGENVSRKRGKKDPEAPKRALCAFFFFSHEKRPEIQSGHPEWKVGQVAQELGRLWKSLPEEMRRKYEEMTARDKSRYEIEMREYKAGKKPAKRPAMGDRGLPPGGAMGANAFGQQSLSGASAMMHPGAMDDMDGDDDDE